MPLFVVLNKKIFLEYEARAALPTPKHPLLQPFLQVATGVCAWQRGLGTFMPETQIEMGKELMIPYCTCVFYAFLFHMHGGTFLLLHLANCVIQ